MTMADDTIKRRGGRSARRKAREKATFVHHPTLVRNVPVYEVVGPEGVEMIHDLAMRIVEELGVEFRDEESLEIWRATDAEIDGYKVRIGRGTLMALVDKAPAEYTHHVRATVITTVVEPPVVMIFSGFGQGMDWLFLVIAVPPIAQFHHLPITVYSHVCCATST